MGFKYDISNSMVTRSFDVNQLYDNFFTADQAVIKKNGVMNAAVWSKGGYVHGQVIQAQGQRHLGSYWSFANEIDQVWTNSWGMYYWSDGEGNKAKNLEGLQVGLRNRRYLS